MSESNAHAEPAAALCFELPLDAHGNPPEWVQLIPPGERVEGIDGRWWINDNPQGVLAFFAARQAAGKDLPFDWEHATELKAPKGEEAPASAWGKAMQIRDGGSIWVRPEWTERGLNSVTSREYRYLSPVLLYDKRGRIVGIRSVGLTNVGNLVLPALNRSSNPSQPNPEKLIMLSDAIRKALGLKDDANDADALAAIETMCAERQAALNRAEAPPLDRFVPRADYDKALNRATDAEKELADRTQAQRAASIEAEVEAAITAKKITPAQKDQAMAMCRAEGGVENFRAFVSAGVPVVDGTKDLSGKPEGAATALNAEQTRIAEAFGNSADDLSKYGGEQ